jgi:hypothetical protein
MISIKKNACKTAPARKAAAKVTLAKVRFRSDDTASEPTEVPTEAPAETEAPTEAELAGPDLRPAFLRRAESDQAAEKADAPDIEAPVRTKITAAKAKAAAKAESTPTQGLCMSRRQALAEGRAAYGEGNFSVTRTVRGEFVWGPPKAPAAIEVAMKSRPAKGAKTAAKAEKKEVRAKAAKAAKADGPRADGIKPGTGAARMIDAAMRKQGATMQDLLDASGWKACRPAFIEACKKAGLTVRLDREQKPSRYYVTA